jgi:hypothetical protein
MFACVRIKERRRKQNTKEDRKKWQKKLDTAGNTKNRQNVDEIKEGRNKKRERK